VTEEVRHVPRQDIPDPHQIATKSPNPSPNTISRGHH
jgi:hypothetical protein